MHKKKIQAKTVEDLHGLQQKSTRLGTVIYEWVFEMNKWHRYIRVQCHITGEGYWTQRHSAPVLAGSFSCTTPASLPAKELVRVALVLGVRSNCSLSSRNWAPFRKYLVKRLYTIQERDHTDPFQKRNQSPTILVITFLLKSPSI